MVLLEESSTEVQRWQKTVIKLKLDLHSIVIYLRPCNILIYLLNLLLTSVKEMIENKIRENGIAEE
jgi:hypothetical protein